MTQKENPREGRGAGNGKSANWYNSPLWDAIEKKKKEKEGK